MDVWEYFVQRNCQLEQLNEAGKWGWELICIYPYNASFQTMNFVFKRVVAPKTEIISDFSTLIEVSDLGVSCAHCGDMLFNNTPVTLNHLYTLVRTHHTSSSCGG